MAAQLRQHRFFEGARALQERRGELARLSRSGGAAAADWPEDTLVGEDQVWVVPSLRDVGASGGSHDEPADSEDEDALTDEDDAHLDYESEVSDDDTTGLLATGARRCGRMWAFLRG